MAHTTLYRRFRPLTFEQIIGQTQTINTLTNQLKSHTLSHAYLFIGSRGTGKTSTAKVLARAVNCENPNGVQPCNQCDTCQSILSDANLDVFEMDAASNNGVDHIRDLKQIVKFPPSQAKYKVIIIDEVHMLSDGAFNALLKTLEEPPSYVLFILATTEPHKIPTTILSRCQRYEFNRITAQQIASTLQKDCETLNIHAENSAIDLIARLADGSMRDARSLLEQCMSHIGDNITLDDATRALGKATELELIELAEAILSKRDTDILHRLNTYYTSGKDIASLFTDLIYLFRTMLRYQVGGEEISINASEAQLKFVAQLAGGYSKTTIIRILQSLIDSYQKIKTSPYAWITAELALLSLTGDDTPNPTVVIPAQAKVINEAATAPSAPNTDGAATGNTTEELAKQVHTAPEGAVEIWEEMLSRIQDKHRPIYALIKCLQLENLEDDILELSLGEDVANLQSSIDTPEHIALIQQTYSDITGKTCRVHIKKQDISKGYKEQITSLFNTVAPQATITME